MKQLRNTFYTTALFLFSVLELASSQAIAEEYFQDAVFEELDRVGVDTKEFKNKLHEGDFSGAKTLLEQEKDKTTLSDVEEEVAQLIARKVVKKVRFDKEKKSEVYSDTASEVETVREDTPQLRKEVSGAAHIPGEEVMPYSGLQKAEGIAPQVTGQNILPEPKIDREALMKVGVRELVPGMSIFRFMKVQVKAWSRLNHASN